MAQHSIGTVQTRSFTFAHPPGGMLLDSGVRLGPVSLAYETLGTLNADRSNAVLVCHALTGDAHVAGHHLGEDKPGWWDHYVGPGKPVDTDRYFVICSNIIGSCMGSCGPASVNPATNRYWGLESGALYAEAYKQVKIHEVHTKAVKHLL